MSGTTKPDERNEGRPQQDRLGHRSEAFLIRLWREPSSMDMEDSVRASVRQLATGEMRYLADLSDMKDHLLSKLDAEANNPLWTNRRVAVSTQKES